MERRFFGGEVRAEGDSGKTISGTASVFYDGTPATEYVLWDDQFGRAVERIMPGAFDGVLSRPDDVRGLFNHDSNNILGRTSAGTMRLAVDAKGLQYTIDAGDTTIARDVSQHLARKDVTGSSFSFSIPPGGQKWTITESNDGKTNEIREITAFDPIYDVGPVTFPAYEATSAGVRNSTQIAELRASRQQDRPSPSSVGVEADRMRLELAEKTCCNFSLDTIQQTN